MSADEREVWLLRLRDGKLSWHSYKDAATREKWAETYRDRGDRVSYDLFLHGDSEASPPASPVSDSDSENSSAGGREGTR